MKKLLAMVFATVMTLSLCVFLMEAEAAGEGQAHRPLYPESSSFKLLGANFPGVTDLKDAVWNDTASAAVGNVDETGSLTVSKRVVGTPPAAVAGGHTIAVMCPNWTPSASLNITKDGAPAAAAVDSANKRIIFTLKGGESVTISGIPVGAKYMVFETFTVIPKKVDATVSGGESGDAASSQTVTGAIDAANDSDTITFTNVYTNAGGLTIHKTVEGRNYKGGTLTFTVEAPEGVTLDQTAAYYGAKSISDRRKLTVEVEVDGTSNEGFAVLDNLPLAQYTVTEVFGPGSSLAPKSGSNKATGTVTLGGNTVVEVVNTYTQPVGSLTVKNTVVGETDPSGEFRFTVTFDNVPDEGFILAGGSSEEIKASGESVGFTIPGEGSVTLDGIPVSVTYTVMETDVPEGYVCAPATASGTIETKDQKKTASFTNYKTGSLQVTKTVTPHDTSVTVPADAEFQINVQFALPTGVSSCVVSYNDTPQTISSKNDTVTVELTGGGSCTFNGLPIGTTYTVEETLTPEQLKNYTSAIDGESGAIGETPSEVAITNTYYAVAEATGALWIRKVVQGSGAGKDPEFPFTVTFTQGDADKEKYDAFISTLNDGSADQTVTLADGANKVFLGIPVGTEYIIVENEATLFEPANVVMSVNPEDGREQNFAVDNGIRQVTGMIDGSRDVDGVTVYNQYLQNLTLELVLDDAAKVPDGVEFTFELRFSGLKADQVSSLMEISDANGTRGSDELLRDFQEDDAVTITLRKGAVPTWRAGVGDGNSLVATIFKVPLGVSHYTITQVGANCGDSVKYAVNSGKNVNPDFDGVSTGDQTFTADTSYVTMKNTYDNRGWLTVEKEVGGEESPSPDAEYTFVISRQEDNTPAGTATVTGAGSETISLPTGDYVVTETTTGDDFNTAYQVNDDPAGRDPAQVTITAGSSPGNVTVTNTYTRPAGSLTVTNMIVGGTVLSENFQFTVTFKDVPAGGFVLTDGSSKKINASGESVKLTIPGGASITLGGIPVGVTYTVTETDVPEGYVYESAAASGKIETRNQQKTASFINYQPNTLGELAIEKEQSINGKERTKEVREVKAGDKVTYYVTVSNISGHDAKAVVITDEIPEGLTLAEGSISGSGTSDGKTVSWNIDVIPVGESVTADFTVTVPEADEKEVWKNTASVSYGDDPSAPKPEFPSNEVEVGETPDKPDTSEKSDTPDKPAPGEPQILGTDTPYTGDSNMVIFWLLLVFIALIGAVASIVFYIKNRK